MKVAIAGAGIAGLASALTLSRRGHDITVFERRTGFGETGAGIQLSPNATRILLDLGLGPALKRTGCEPDRVVIRALRSGATIGTVAMGAFMRERFGAPFVAIARSDLHTALLDAVRGRSNIRLRIGRGVVGLAQREAGVEVETEGSAGSRDVATVDLLIGADGLWSRVRELMGDRRRPRYGGHAAYRATVPRAAVPETLRGNETGLWLGRGRHVVHYPIAGGTLVNIVVVAPRREAVEGWSNAEDRALPPALLKDGAASLGQLLATPREWSSWSLYELPARVASEGRVALVGDAAHPILPYLAQGGSLAIEDAASLARVGQEANIERSLRRHAADRLGRSRKVQVTARRNGAIYHAGFPVSVARDAVMRRLSPVAMAERYAWLYGWTETAGDHGAA